MSAQPKILTPLVQRLLMLAFALQAGWAAAAEPPIPVFTSLIPHAEFVAEIGGPQVDVSVLVGPGHSPANYQPTPRQMASLSKARLFVAADVPFELGLLPKIMAANSDLLVIGNAAASATGRESQHETNPHAWLNPLHVMALADSICQQLSFLAPEHASKFAVRRDQMKQRLVQLDQQISDQMAPYHGREFFVFHPAYGHFAARYHLVQVAVEDEGHEPSARQLVELIERAKAADAQIIIVQPQFSLRSAEAVANSCQAEVLVLDPLAEYYEQNLRHIAKTLASAWGAES